MHGFRVPTQVFMAGPAAQRAWIVTTILTARTGASTGSATGSDSPPTITATAAVPTTGSAPSSGWSSLTAPTRRWSAPTCARPTWRRRNTCAEPASCGPWRCSTRPAAPAEVGRSRAARAAGRVPRCAGAQGRPEDRAEAAELLLNYLEALEMPLAFADLRAAIRAHVRAGHAGRAAELLERAVAVPVTEPARWFSMVQLLTEGGQLDRASAMLAGIARGDHPEALNRRRLRGDPARRIAAARVRLERARQRAASASAALGGGNHLDRGDAERLQVGADQLASPTASISNWSGRISRSRAATWPRPRRPPRGGRGRSASSHRPGRRRPIGSIAMATPPVVSKRSGKTPTR